MCFSRKCFERSVIAKSSLQTRQGILVDPLMSVPQLQMCSKKFSIMKNDSLQLFLGQLRLPFAISCSQLDLLKT